MLLALLGMCEWKSLFASATSVHHLWSFCHTTHCMRIEKPDFYHVIQRVFVQFYSWGETLINWTMHNRNISIKNQTTSITFWVEMRLGYDHINSSCLKINFIQSPMIQNILLFLTSPPTPTHPSCNGNHMSNAITFAGLNQSQKQIKYLWHPVAYFSNIDRRTISILFRVSYVSLPLARCYGDDTWRQSTGNTQPPWMGLSQPGVLIASITGLILQARPDNSAKWLFCIGICCSTGSSISL